MKQPSTRGRKKTVAGKTSPSRGATSTQHRNRTSPGSHNNGSPGRSGNSSNTGNFSSGRPSGGGSTSGRNSPSSHSNDPDGRNNSPASRNNGPDGRNNGPASHNNGPASRNNGPDNRNNSANGTNMRGASSANSRNSRDRGDERNAQQEFTGKSHLEKFFLDQLQDIYYAENKITQSLPKMAAAATTGELKEAFEDHLHQTQRHIKRLEKAFESIGKTAEGKKCEAIEGITREVENIITETEEGTLTRDAALIIAAQKVEHYEIATYGGLVQLAITMNLHDAADLLDKTLVEEEDTDARLTEIAENEINLRAEHEDDQGSWNSEDSEGEQEEEGEIEYDADENSSVR